MMIVLLLSFLIALLILIFSLSARTELKIASNDLQGRQALAIAEAGISHALRVIAPSAEDGLGLDEELGNSPTGGLVGLGSQVAIVENATSYNYRCASFGGIPGSRYCIHARDNFDETAGADSATDDIDNAIVLRARGTAGTAVRVVDAMVGVSIGPECAILTQGNLQLPAQANITGSKGCIHTNSVLTISGSPTIVKGATASSTSNISGVPVLSGLTLNTAALKDQYETDHSSQPLQSIPSVRPMKFGPMEVKLFEHVSNHPRGFRLDADGNIYVGPGYFGLGGPGGPWTCVDSPVGCTGGRALLPAEILLLGLDTFKIEAKSWGAQWISDKDFVVPGVYFVEGSVILSKNWGLSATPWRATIIAINSIQMPGKPIMAPYQQSTNSAGAGHVTSASPLAEWTLRNLLLVSGNDIEINGDAGNNNFAGGLFAHQQIKVNGNPDVRGFFIAEDGLSTWAGDPAPNCTSDSNLLCDPDGNSLSGNPNIIFNGLSTALYPDKILRLSWDDVR